MNLLYTYCKLKSEIYFVVEAIPSVSRKNRKKLTEGTVKSQKHSRINKQTNKQTTNNHKTNKIAY